MRGPSHPLFVFALAGVASFIWTHEAQGPQRTFLGGGGPAGRGAFTWTQRIDFEQAPAGTQVTSVTSNGGFGPVTITGINPLLPGQNAAVLLDSANPTGGDFDLGAPQDPGHLPDHGSGDAPARRRTPGR